MPMSLPPRRPPAVPADTAAVARAAFRRGNPYLQVRDTLGPLFADADFYALYAHEGQPALSPACLALVTLLQYAEGLADRHAADAVRSRIDWKYLLGLSLDDSGFDASVLSEFRGRLVKGNAEAQLFDRLLAVFRDQGMLRAGGEQRTDSTHVLAAVTMLNRLERVGETLRYALNVLAHVAPAWLRAHSDPAWAERYGPRLAAARLPKEEPKRRALAEQIGRDGFQLLAAIDDPDAPPTLRDVEAVQILRRVWAQQYHQGDDGSSRWRREGELPPASELIISPYDPEARYAVKRESEWEGYKVHLTETCDPDEPILITEVETTDATVPDSELTDRVQQRLVDSDLAPGRQYVDAGYVDAALLVASGGRGIDLFGPVRPDSSWQGRAGEGFDQAHFLVDWESGQVTCPQGNLSSSWRETDDRRGGQVIKVSFSQRDCGDCPVRAKCTRAERRTLTLYPQALHEAMSRARERQQTATFAKGYARRAGIEGTISQGVRRCGLRRARYRGTPKVHLQHLLTAASLNLVRVAAWLQETPRADTRHSSFARLMAQAA
jgi:transposase